MPQVTQEELPGPGVYERLMKRVDKMMAATDDKYLSALSKSRMNTVLTAMRRVTSDLDTKQKKQPPMILEPHFQLDKFIKEVLIIAKKYKIIKH